MTATDQNRILTRNEEAYLMRQGVLKALEEYKLHCLQDNKNNNQSPVEEKSD